MHFGDNIKERGEYGGLCSLFAAKSELKTCLSAINDSITNLICCTIYSSFSVKNPTLVHLSEPTLRICANTGLPGQIESLSININIDDILWVPTSSFLNVHLYTWARTDSTSRGFVVRS